MDPLGITGFRKRKAKEKAALEQGIIEDLPQVDDDSEPTLYPWVLDGNTKLKNENGEALDNDFIGCYIRWDALALLFNVRFTPINEKDGSVVEVGALLGSVSEHATKTSTKKKSTCMENCRNCKWQC